MLEDVGPWIFQMPDFIHEFGDDIHHLCPAGYHDSDAVYVVHQCFDRIFYCVQKWLGDWIGDNRLYEVLSAILGFAWGFNCLFPPQDVVLYTVWSLRGCKPVKVWSKKGTELVSIYPRERHAVEVRRGGSEGLGDPRGGQP